MDEKKIKFIKASPELSVVIASLNFLTGKMAGLYAELKEWQKGQHPELSAKDLVTRHVEEIEEFNDCYKLVADKALKIEGYEANSLIHFLNEELGKIAFPYFRDLEAVDISEPTELN